MHLQWNSYFTLWCMLIEINLNGPNSDITISLVLCNYSLFFDGFTAMGAFQKYVPFLTVEM